jgi:hypothetical protein
MSSLQEQWKDYRDACYPQGLEGTQNRETHQAFFAGALVALKLVIEDSHELPPEEAQRAIAKVIEEAKGVCNEHVFAFTKSRN